MSSDREAIRTPNAARDDLGAERSKPAWLEKSHSLPFGELSDDEFEIFCYLLVKAEYPDDEIIYYGKTADLGRDIVHKRSDGSYRLIQCKRYSQNVGIGEVRGEVSKLFVNVFEKKIPVQPEEVCFYAVPDLTGPSKDLITNQAEWKAIARAALQEYLGKTPSTELVVFAESWWPFVPTEERISLTVRCKARPELLQEFFRVHKVIDATLKDVQETVDASAERILVAISNVSESISSAAQSGTFHDQIDLAVGYMKEGKTEVAIAFLMRLKSRDWDAMPERAKYRTLANLGHCHTRQEKFGEALLISVRLVHTSRRTSTDNAT